MNTQSSQCTEVLKEKLKRYVRKKYRSLIKSIRWDSPVELASHKDLIFRTGIAVNGNKYFFVEALNGFLVGTYS